MSFATEKDKSSSKRFALMRVAPARNVTTTLASLGSGTYSVDLPAGAIACAVKRNGTTLSKVTSLVSNDQWMLSGQTVTVKIASAPSSTTNVIIVTYYLFFSSDEGTVTYETPTDSTSALRLWEPRIASVPSFKQDFSDALAGVFAISDTSIELANSDAALQPFFSASDSWNEKDVEIWMAITSIENLQLIYKGKVKAADFSADTLTLGMFDAFSPMSQTAFMGDTRFEAFFLQHASSKPNMDPTRTGAPCRYVAGWSNRAISRCYFGGKTVVNFIPEIDFRFAEGEEAVNVNVTPVATKTVNRSWGLGRIGGTLRMTSAGAIQAIGFMTGDIVFGYVFIRFATHNYDIGDTFEWVQSGSTYRGVVTRVTDFVYLGTTYNLCVWHPESSGGYPNFQVTSTVTSKKKLGIAVFGDLQWQYGRPTHLVQDTDYAITQTTTSGGNTYVEITLANNFENRYAQFTDPAGGANLPLDPARQQLIFKIYPSVAANHADVLKRLVDAAGITTESTSFAAAGVALDANAYFTIPNFDESDYGTYQRYAEDILRSTMGYLKINLSAQAEYHLLAAPSSGDAIDSNVHIGDLRYSIDYQDIVTEIVAENPHEGTAASQSTAENVAAKYLHGIRRTDQLRHVLASISGRIDALMAARSSRRAAYRFKVATALLDAMLGDDVTLTSSLLPGAVAADNLKIMTIDKSADEVAVEAIDLEGL